MDKKITVIPKMCITCQHFDLYHCKLKDRYIGYLECAEPTKCEDYKLSDDYREGGKWYEGETNDSGRED